jgi:hypothetical protein
MIYIKKFDRMIAKRINEGRYVSKKPIDMELLGDLLIMADERMSVSNNKNHTNQNQDIATDFDFEIGVLSSMMLSGDMIVITLDKTNRMYKGVMYLTVVDEYTTILTKSPITKIFNIKIA